MMQPRRTAPAKGQGNPMLLKTHSIAHCIHCNLGECLPGHSRLRGGPAREAVRNQMLQHRVEDCRHGQAEHAVAELGLEVIRIGPRIPICTRDRQGVWDVMAGAAHMHNVPVRGEARLVRFFIHELAHRENVRIQDIDRWLRQLVLTYPGPPPCQ